MVGKKSFILYSDLIHTVNKLPDNKAGQLFKIILAYVNDNKISIPSKDIVLQVAFEPIRQQLTRDLEHWTNVKKIRSENGKKGGRPKKQIEAKKANGFYEKQTKAKKAVTDNENDTVSENEISDIFENFRKKYPGTKRGLETELQNFLKKDAPEVVQLLLPALLKEIEWRKEAEQQGEFVAPWKHLSSWINQKCWEQEFPKIDSKQNNKHKPVEGLQR